MNHRSQAAKILASLLNHGKTIDVLFNHNEEATTKAYVYQTCRWFFQLDAIANHLLTKPMKEKDNDVFCLLLIGLCDLLQSDNKEHAVVSETVNSTKALKKPWAKGLLNACLRKFLREKEALLEAINKDEQAHYAHPQWFIDSMKSAWPDNWQTILNANNHQAPMFLRLNPHKGHIDNYQQQADNITAPTIQLKEAVAVEKLSGFHQGHVSVQDQASQYVAPLLSLQSQHKVLDACSAPGGKTGHLLETQADISLTALDISDTRLEKVKQNLDRLGFSATLKAADASDTQSWWDGELFDRILIDAPCSGSGVIRRHPDIKLLRRETDIAGFAKQQLALLTSLWPLLKPQGILLYTTCSVLPQENAQLVESFLEQVKDASVVDFELPIGQPCDIGWQCFPQINSHDGFYYCLLSHQ